MVDGVGDEQHTIRADRDRRRCSEYARSAVARDRGDRAVRRALSNAVVGAVGDVHVARVIEGKTRREVEIRRRGRTTVAAERGSAAAGKQDDVAAMIDPSYAVVVRVGDEETPIRGYGDPDGCKERGGSRDSAVAGVTALAVSDHGGDRSIRADLADDIVLAVGAV